LFFIIYTSTLNIKNHQINITTKCFYTKNNILIRWGAGESITKAVDILPNYQRIHLLFPFKTPLFHFSFFSCLILHILFIFRFVL